MLNLFLCVHFNRHNGKYNEWLGQIDPPFRKVEKNILEKTTASYRFCIQRKLFGGHFCTLAQIIGFIRLFKTKVEFPKQQKGFWMKLDYRTSIPCTKRTKKHIKQMPHGLAQKCHAKNNTFQKYAKNYLCPLSLSPCPCPP